MGPRVQRAGITPLNVGVGLLESNPLSIIVIIIITVAAFKRASSRGTVHGPGLRTVASRAQLGHPKPRPSLCSPVVLRSPVPAKRRIPGMLPQATPPQVSTQPLAPAAPPHSTPCANLYPKFRHSGAAPSPVTPASPGTSSPQNRAQHPRCKGGWHKLLPSASGSPPAFPSPLFMKIFWGPKAWPQPQLPRCPPWATPGVPLPLPKGASVRCPCTPGLYSFLGGSTSRLHRPLSLFHLGGGPGHILTVALRLPVSVPLALRRAAVQVPGLCTFPLAQTTLKGDVPYVPAGGSWSAQGLRALGMVVGATLMGNPGEGHLLGKQDP